MGKIILHDKDTQDSILEGARKLAKAVAVTMGPRGKNVILGKFIGAPVITKDGVSVAREIVLRDPVENLVAQLIKEAAGRTADIAGDGTTTATVLTEEIIKRGKELIASGYSPLDFRNGINLTLELLLVEIDKLTRKVSSDSDLQNIATISANNDPVLGSKIAEAFSYAGIDGTVIAEANPGSETYVKKSKGVEFKSGFVTPAFLSQGQTEINIENCYIMIVNREMSHFSDCIKIFTEIHNKNIPVLVLAKSIQKEALATLVENNRLGRIKAVAVNIGSHFPNEDSLENLAILTGATIAGEGNAKPISEITIDDLGFCKMVSVNKYNTKLIEGRVDEEKLKNKMTIYNYDLQKLLSETDRKNVKRKMSFLNSKAAIVSVGYSTELELREKSDRVDDSLHATRAALESGIVAGGGVTLVKACQNLDMSNIPKKLVKAAEVLIESCNRPITQILLNADLDPKIIISKINSSKEQFYGYNVVTESYGDMFEQGIVDPAKVTKSAVTNATSIALLLINTETIISEDPDKPTGWQPPAGWRPPDENSLNHKY